MGRKRNRRRAHGRFAPGTTSNSSTAPPANSPVGDRDYMKIGTFKHRVKHSVDSVFVATTIRTVTQAICEIYAQRGEGLPFEALYRQVYFLTLHRKGEELYSAVEAAMASEVQSLFSPLDAAPGEDDALFLEELMAKWNQHIEAVKMVRDMLMYMDWTFVVTNRKTRIKELGLRLWRDHLASSSGKIRERFIQAVNQRGGGEDDELVAAVNELSEDVPGLFFPDSEVHAAGHAKCNV